MGTKLNQSALYDIVKCDISPKKGSSLVEILCSAEVAPLPMGGTLNTEDVLNPGVEAITRLLNEEELAWLRTGKGRWVALDGIALDGKNMKLAYVIGPGKGAGTEGAPDVTGRYVSVDDGRITHVELLLGCDRFVPGPGVISIDVIDTSKLVPSTTVRITLQVGRGDDKRTLRSNRVEVGVRGYVGAAGERE